MALALGSCQKEEITQLANQETGVNAKANIIRNRIKRRNNGLYKTVMVISNEDPTLADVAIIELSLSGTSTDQPVQSTVILDYAGDTEDGFKKFTNNQIEYTEDIVGQIVTTTAVFKDDAGNEIGQPVVSNLTVKGAELAIKKSTLKINSDGEKFTGKVVLDRESLLEQDQLDLVLAPGATVTMSIIPDDGGSEADPETFELELTNETLTKLIFKNSGVTFIEPDNVVDMEYIAVVTVSDSGGEELDYAEFRITGQE